MGDATPERWLPVVGYEGSYEVSDLGRVRSVPRVDTSGHRRRGVVLKPGPDLDGYRRVALSRGSRLRSRKVATLVAEAFIGPRPPGMVVRHDDGDHTNDAASNLIYGTAAENVKDTVRHGTHKNTRKTCCPKCGAPYSIRFLKDGRARRYCQPCRSAVMRKASQKYWAKVKAERQAAASPSQSPRPNVPAA